MDMNGIKITCKVKLSLTADEWALYDKPGVKAVARSMNAKVAKALNAGDFHAAFAVLREYQDFGASDTEPEAVLNVIMDKMGFA
jgi:hypothetical protein